MVCDKYTHLYVCISIYMYLHVFVYIYTYFFVYSYVCICTHIRVYKHLCVFIRIYTYWYVLPLSYPRRGPPWGDPPQPPSLSICGGCCFDCIQLHIPDSFYLLSSFSVALLKQTCSLLLLAYCFSCNFLASRSTIAQVSTFVVKQ